MNSKVRDGAAEAMEGMRDGATIMAGGFGLCGNAELCIQEIQRRGWKDLTLIGNNAGNQGKGLAVLLKNRQIRKARRPLRLRRARGERERDGYRSEHRRCGGVRVRQFRSRLSSTAAALGRGLGAE